MGLLARMLEEAGIPTIAMSSALDITWAVKPPRAVFLNFPLGHTAGKPNDPELQRQILRHALREGAAMQEPGCIHVLPYEWGDDSDVRWRVGGRIAAE